MYFSSEAQQHTREMWQETQSYKHVMPKLKMSWLRMFC